MSIHDIIENFELFDDWEDRYRYIIDLGKKLPDFPEEYRKDEFKVSGCQSQVWIVPLQSETPDEHLSFLADSDSSIVRGLIAILLEMYNDKTPDEILKTDYDEHFSKIGLESHLSPTRKNGLSSMIKRIREVANSRK